MDELDPPRPGMRVVLRRPPTHAPSPPSPSPRQAPGEAASPADEDAFSQVFGPADDGGDEGGDDGGALLLASVEAAARSAHMPRARPRTARARQAVHPPRPVGTRLAAATPHSAAAAFGVEPPPHALAQLCVVGRSASGDPARPHTAPSLGRARASPEQRPPWGAPSSARRALQRPATAQAAGASLPLGEDDASAAMAGLDAEAYAPSPLRRRLVAEAAARAASASPVRARAAAAGGGVDESCGGTAYWLGASGARGAQLGTLSLAKAAAEALPPPAYPAGATGRLARPLRQARFSSRRMQFYRRIPSEHGAAEAAAAAAAAGALGDAAVLRTRGAGVVLLYTPPTARPARYSLRL